MPRTSFQVFTDTTTKIVNAYGGTGEANQGKVPVDTVIFTLGSSAGAGSGEFHKYLGARNREKDRIEKIELSSAMEEEKVKFAAKIEQNRREAEERTKRNAEKRKKLKQKKIIRKKQKIEGEVGKKEENSDEVSDNKQTEESAGTI
jgi:hypothetical protein